MSVTIRGSEYQDFLRCRLKWDYAWRKNLVSKTPNDKLFVGTLIHKFLEVYYANGGVWLPAYEAMAQFFQESDKTGMEQVAIDDLWNMIQAVTSNYHKQYAEVDNWQVLATELTFRIRINSKVTYTGTIDLVALDENGNLFFMDHKTTASLEKYEKNAIMDRQISRYWWALEQLVQGKGEVLSVDTWIPTTAATSFYENIKGRPVSYFVYNIILKDFPVPPRVLKKGDLSKDKSQNTTYELYWQEIERLGLNPEPYQDFLQYLQENPRQFFKRVEVRRNPAEVRAAMREFYETALDMGDGPRIYRNITSDCHWDCGFKDVCMAGFDGSNVNLLLSTLYRVKEAKD